MAGRSPGASVVDAPFTDADAAPAGSLQTPAQRRADRNTTVATMRHNDRATRQRYERGGDLYEPDPAPADSVMGTRPSTSSRAATTRKGARRAAGLARSSGRGLGRLAGGKRPVTFGGFVGGMLLYAMGLQLIRNGPAGLASWFAAKFWNNVTPPGTSFPSQGTVGTLPGGAAEKALALQQANADMATACAGSASTSAACAAAKQRVANIQSLQVTG